MWSLGRGELGEGGGAKSNLGAHGEDVVQEALLILGGRCTAMNTTTNRWGRREPRESCVWGKGQPRGEYREAGRVGRGDGPEDIEHGGLTWYRYA